jgi:bifunctional NMN adenylyltransferase/nudix hydrolase
MVRDNTVGVVVGRFQTTALHFGHRFVLDRAVADHEEILVILGCTPARTSKRDPLDYETRKAMILAAYPAARVARLEDCGADALWSERLDEVIAKEFPGKAAILYGSWNSFIPQYCGTHRCEMLRSPNHTISATDVRNRVAQKPLASADFRAGVIYASHHQKPVSYQTVDVAIVDYDNKRILLGARTRDQGLLRFIGGFVDPTDQNLEHAAQREVLEETSGIEISNLEYLGSFRVNDWRYRGKEDSILTALFTARFIFGAPRAADDLDGLEWIPWEAFRERLVDEHQALGEKLQTHLTSPTAHKEARP